MFAILCVSEGGWVRVSMPTTTAFATFSIFKRRLDEEINDDKRKSTKLVT